ncbi:hypothetical protein [Streptomyces sp. Cmuel-A718b]|uniref:hypothetical protein n=1 Tax=Streptomyces sp. Cmuel-A718b TaxID=697328 RepID=UPI00159EFD59|nr:hypothetical protein [Streptomyces sp. Cmuel-A718b]
MARIDVLTLVLVGATLARSVFLTPPGTAPTPTAAPADATGAAETELQLLLAALARPGE